MNKVAISYHFFPHYREPVFQALMDSDEYSYLFFGDDTDPDQTGIEPWEFPPEVDFTKTATYVFPRGVLIQRGMVSLAFRRDIDSIIYLGNVKYLSTWISAIIARLSGKKVLFWTHGWRKKDSQLGALVRDSFYRLSHKLLLYGNYAREIGIKKGFDPKNLHVIFNSLDYEQQTSLRQQLTYEELSTTRKTLFLNPNLPTIIAIGRLTPRKDIEMLIEVTSILGQRGIKVNVLIVGSGPMLEILKAKASKCTTAEFVFYGACYDERELAKLISLANVNVMPGDIGLAAMHSLAYGVPVVTHNNAQTQGPEWEAIIPGYNGDLYQFGDIESLANAIEPWLHNGLNSQTLRDRCYAVVEKFYTPKFQKDEIEKALAGYDAEIHRVDSFISDNTKTASLKSDAGACSHISD